MSRRCGFSLTEMVLAVLLASLVVIAVASIFMTVFRDHVENYQKNVIQGGQIAALNAMTRDISATTMFVAPSAPCSFSPTSGNYTCSGPMIGDTLRGCSNYDYNAAGALNILNPNARMRVYQYCFTPANPSELWYYWQESSGSPPYAALDCTSVSWPACGSQAASPWNTMKLAQLVGRESGFSNLYFRRPANSNNTMEIHFQVGSGTAAVTVDTLVSSMEPLRSIRQ